MHLEERIVVATRIYLDESEGDAAYVAAGWAFPANQWDEISDRWQTVLEEKPKIPYFKLNHAMGLKGPFEGWSECARDAKITALARTLPHQDGFYGHGCYVARADFDAVTQGIRRVYRAPYFFCMAVAMVYAVAGDVQIVGANAEKIEFVLDRSREAVHMRKLFYSDIKPRFPRLGECLDLDDRETPPLQAADLCAGAIRQLYEPTPRVIPGISALNGIFCGPLELKKKGLEDMIATPLFKKKPIPS